MALYVIPVPVPPVGTDWAYTVPGQYIEHITAISATLTSSTSFATLADSSGNGRHGSYTQHGGYPQTTPGIVAGDAAIRTADPNLIVAAGGGNMPALGFDRAGPLTIEFWLTLTTAVDQTGFVGYWNAFAPSRQVWLSVSDGGSVQFVRQQTPLTQEYHWDVSATVTDGLPHQYVLTYDGTAAVLYIDAAAQTPDVADPFITVAATDVPGSCFQQNPPLPGVNADADELSIYPAALSAGQVTAHHAAGLAGIAAYTAAVLADSPAAYYHLDDGSGAPRQVDLIVTDGTHTVLEVPTGFNLPALDSPWLYSWQPGLNSATFVADGAIETIATPKLILPAGYTIGTRTFEIAPPDQWSDIHIWWNSDIMDANPQLNPIDYPPGAYLVIVPQGA